MRPFLGVNPVTIRKGFTQPPQCMPDEYKHPNSVIAYRKYYAGEKAHFAKWKNGNVPAWFTLLTTVNTNQMEANYA